MASTRTRKTPVKAKQVYFAELKIGDTLYTAGAPTALEALNELAPQVPREMVCTKSVLRLVKDGRFHAEIMHPVKLRRFLANPLTRHIWAKTFAPN